MKNIYGWTGKILKVNLSDQKKSEMDTLDYTRRFIGGRGIGTKIYWDDLSPDRDAFHPESPFIIMTGPLAGTTAPSGARWIVCGKSPALYPENFISSNLGGFFGADLKKAGYDGIVIIGQARGKVYLSISKEKIEIKDASHLWGLTTSQTMLMLRKELGEKTRLLTTGPAGENRIRFATVATDIGGSGSMGFGAVMGSKNLKAIAVQGKGVLPVAHPDRITRLVKRIRQMTGEGYLNIYDADVPIPEVEVVKKVRCYGCPQGCWRTLYRGASGTEGVIKCQAKFYYSLWDRERHGDMTQVSFLATSLANEYSLCTMELPGILIWLEKCIKNGVITEKDTGLPMSKIGSLEFIETAVKKISFREGFGNVLAEGVMRAADSVGKPAKKIAEDHFTQTGRGIAYGPKVFLPSALIYATEPRASTPQLHEICEPAVKWAFWYTTQGAYSYVSTDVYRNIAKRFWGSEKAADFSTHEGKALAAVKIQNRQYAKECLILCDFVFPIFDDAGTQDHAGDPTLESRIFTAATGIDTDEEGLNRTGERIFNLYRAILLQEGRKGRRDDYLPESQFIERDEPVYDVFGMFNPDLFLPGAGDEIISRKGKALDRDKFEQMLDEYYELRGWDKSTGLIKKETLQKLGLTEDI